MMVILKTFCGLPKTAVSPHTQNTIGIGGGVSPLPPTPPDMRVRIRRFDCVMATFYCRVEPFLYTVTPITPPPWTLTLGLQPTLPVQPALFRQISVAYVIPFLSTQLLCRLALRPVGGFHPPPRMVVTPSTTMASAVFCLLFSR